MVDSTHPLRVDYKSLEAQITITPIAPPPTIYCGAYQQLSVIPENYTGPVYYDRFSNAYPLPEIQAMMAQATTELDAGRFKLRLSNVPPGINQTLIDVFTQVSNTVDPGGTQPNVPILIEWGNVSGTAGAVASAFQFLADCKRIENAVMLGIRTGDTGMALGLVAGKVSINPNLPWYTGPASAIPNNQYDLHTAVLHEALHLLGIASLIENNNAATHYTEYDRYLTKKLSNGSYVPLIHSITDLSCCSVMAPHPNAPQTFNDGCSGNIFVGNIAGQPTNDIIEVAYLNDNGTPGSLDNIPNKLSHFDINCSNGSELYVMHPGVPAAPQQWSVRRTITPREIEVLCRIGYPDAESCGDCTLLVRDDFYPTPVFLNNAEGMPVQGLSFDIKVNLSFDIQAFPILQNDIVPSGYMVEIFDGLDPNDEFTITTNSFLVDYLTVSINSNATPGTKKFTYRISACGQCQYGTVSFQLLDRPVATSCDISSDCNLVCFGDFEDFPILPEGSNYEPFIGQTPALFNGSTTLSTPDIKYFEYLQSKVAAFSRNSTASEIEGLIVPLSTPILGQCEVNIRYEWAIFHSNLVNWPQANDARIEVFGFSGYPCSSPSLNPILWPVGEPAGNLPQILCDDIKLYRLNQNSGLIADPEGTIMLTLQPHNFPYNHPINEEPITHLLFHLDFNPAPPTPSALYNQLVTFLDNIQVTSSCTNQLTITAQEPIILPCQGETINIPYEVCLTGSGPASSITLQADIQDGFQNVVEIIPGGGFDANGVAQLNLTPTANCDNGTTTLILQVKLFPNIIAGTSFSINLNNTTNNTCMNTLTSTNEVTFLVQDCSVDPTACNCPAAPNPVVIGSNANSVNYLSLLDLLTLKQSDCISVNGKFIIDQDWTFSGVRLIMNQGAEIVVENDITLSIFDHSVLEGCNNMWKGVVVYGRLDMQHSFIYDAQWAVEPRYKSEINLQNNMFDRNFVGVHLRVPTQDPPNGVIVIAFTENEFRCTAPLKAAYAGQDPVPGELTYAGVFLNNYNGSGFKIGTGNTFLGIRNGIVSDRANFEVINASFSYLSDYVPPSASGIFALSNHGVYVRSTRSAKVTNCSMNKLARGITAKSSNISATFNTITTNALNSGNSPSYGINITQNDYCTTVLHMNNVRGYQYAIGVFNTTVPTKLSIQNNPTVALLPGPVVKRSCILLDKVKNGFVYNNNISIEGGTNYNRGLYMNNCTNMKVGLNDFFDLGTGVLALGSNNNYFYSNTVGNSTSPIAGNGFVVENGSNSFCNNTTAQLSGIGFSFAGACNTTDLRCSNIGPATHGLYLWADNSDPNQATHPTTIIGLQNQRNNTWVGGSEAYHDEGLFPFYILDSKFTQTIIPPFNTTYSINTGIPVEWFNQESGMPSNCANCDQPTPGFSEGGGDDRTDIKETEVTLADAGYPNAALSWMGRQRLYERMDENTELQAEPELSGFYTQEEESTLGQLEAVGDELERLLYGADYEQRGLRELSQTIQATFDSVVLYASLPASPMRDSRLAHFRARLDWDVSRMATYEKWLDNRTTQSAPTIAAWNNGISGNDAFIKNERDLTGMYLNEQLWRISSNSTGSDLERVKMIADQCPHFGGWAVYQARSLYTEYYPEVTWDLGEGCGRTKERSMDGDKAEALSLVIYPNPTSTALQLHFGQAVASETEFQLFDLSGRSVLQQRIAEGVQSIQVDLPDLQDGLYFYRVIDQTGNRQSGRIGIIH
jgi:Secretion system C-terminal sorting domain